MRDTYGLVPDHIRANYELDEAVERNRRGAVALDQALKLKDPRLSCVYVKEHAEPKYGIKPGYWHVRVAVDPPLADHFIPIQTPEGGFREPDSGVIYELEANDLQRRPELMPELETVEENPGFPTKRFKPDPSVERAKETAAEQRKDQMAEDIRAGRRVAGEEGLTKRRWARG